MCREVREAATQKVVTVIEILSPSNKRGQGREKYLAKRQKIFASQTNLVEINLLREGLPMPLAQEIQISQYRVLCSRSSDGGSSSIQSSRFNSSVSTSVAIE